MLKTLGNLVFVLLMLLLLLFFWGISYGLVIPFPFLKPETYTLLLLRLIQLGPGLILLTMAWTLRGRSSQLTRITIGLCTLALASLSFLYVLRMFGR